MFTCAFVVPAFNEAQGITTFLTSLRNESKALCTRFGGSRYVALIVDDGSEDQTAERVEQASAVFSEPGFTVELIPLVRKFGYQSAVLAGLARACELADFAVVMDADGENPPSLVGQLIDGWLQGHPIVHTRREENHQLSWFKRTTSRAYYATMRLTTGLEMESGMADFKLWDTALLKANFAAVERSGSTRAFAAWLAPNAPIVTYPHVVAEGRVSRFSLRRMIKLAMPGLMSFSTLPLRFALFAGVLSLSVGIFFGAFAINAYFHNQTVSGWTSLVSVVCLFGGLNSLATGLVSEYLLRERLQGHFPSFVVNPRVRRPVPLKSERAAVRSAEDAP